MKDILKRGSSRPALHPWLTELPATWSTGPLKRFITRMDSGVSVNAFDIPAEEGQLGVLKTSCVYSGKFNPTQNKTVVEPERDLVACPVRVGTLIVSRMNTPDLVGAAGLVQEAAPDLYLPDRLWQITFHGLEPRFAHYWTQSRVYRAAVNAACAGTSASMQNLSQDDLRGFPIAAPGWQIQVQLADLLDRDTTRIDALIEKKTRFIDLLREKRQALITQAVTRGLDPTVPMKDSGVEWIGCVPRDWSVCKLSYRYTVELGKMLDEKRFTGAHSTPYLRNQDVQWERINSHGLPSMDIAPAERERYTVQSGDLLVCEGGDVGRAAIWLGDGGNVGYQKALHRLRPRDADRDTSDFLALVLRVAKNAGAFEEGDSKATISHLPAEKFRQYLFAFPSLAEQRNIAACVRVLVERLDRLAVKAKASVELLRERRAALITAAVTGQIDVWEPA